MKKFIMAKKIGMTQIIDEHEMVVPVTVAKAEDALVLKVKTKETDHYESILIGFGLAKEKKCTKSHLGIFKPAAENVGKVALRKYLKEFRVKDCSTYQIGQPITVDSFTVHDKVHVRGLTIGRGFAGTIKRWNFHRGPMTHGSKKHRLPGSIGAGTGYGHVLKGKKMAGHYGHEYVTMKNIEIVKIDSEKGLLYLKGAVPGKENNLLEIYL